MKRAAELIKCAVILHNLCILFSDNGDDPLDDANLDNREEQEDRQQQLLQHFLVGVRKIIPMTLQNLNCFNIIKREQSTTKYAIFFGRAKLICHLLLNDDIH